MICVHPDARHRPRRRELPQVRVQVKSRFATDCDRSFLVSEKTLDAFDYLVGVFLNIGRFFGRHDGSTGAQPCEFYTLPQGFIREHHDATSTWQKVRLRGMESEIEEYRNENGFELIAKALGVLRPRKRRGIAAM